MAKVDALLFFLRFLDAERRARRLKWPQQKPLKEGQTATPVSVNARQASELLRIAARQSAGLPDTTQHTEVVWVDGDRELAVNVASLQVEIAEGVIRVAIPVRCDQAANAVVKVVFAVGTRKEPSGLYASTYRRPDGPALIVDAWGEPLVAFAWQCVLGMVDGVAGAVGRDDLGEVLVPAELTATKAAIDIVPMARQRFSDPRPR